MINQLFKRIPTKNELTQILNCFNIKSLDEDKTFGFTDLIYNNCIDKLYDITNILMELYLPCKFFYINNLNNKKAITLLRQICKLYDRKIIQNFIVINKIKIIKFKIFNKDSKTIVIEKNKNLVF
mgnify:CR=1 FL=1|tara:strand:+ start:258 stop:632 length:375 start_codon:yes stop_codon:yes gene_type:complete